MSEKISIQIIQVENGFIATKGNTYGHSGYMLPQFVFTNPVDLANWVEEETTEKSQPKDVNNDRKD